MRVSISPSGSFMGLRLLPARLHHPGNHALARQLAQHVAANLELAVIAARATGQLAAVAHARRRGVARQLGELEPRGKALFRLPGQVGGELLQLFALARVLRHQLAPMVVLIDGTDLSHAFLQRPYSGRGPHVRNGKLKPRNRARASSSVAADVQTITSMPQISSTSS